MVARATRLFEFLGRAQQLKSQTPRSVASYQKDGSVLWLADLPHHTAVRSAHRVGEPDHDDDLLVIDRVPRLAAPEAVDALQPWLADPTDDPDRIPGLRKSLPIQDEPDDEPAEEIGPPPDIIAQYERWLDRWQVWAEQELLDRQVREIYSHLFSTYLAATSHSEEFELVVGIGCLAWNPPGHPVVKRHLLTAPISIQFDDDTGQITVRRVDSADAVKVELDMLDPGLVTNPLLVNDVREKAKVLDDHPLNRDTVGSLARRLVHILDADGEYLDLDGAPEAAGHATAHFAPAIIRRKRSRQGLVDIFHTIIGQLAGATEVPDGIRPLIDPDHRPSVTSDRTDGALVVVDDDPFLPLPVNDVQLRILRQVDTRAQTLVQGPPGTGKTHTAAALLSHLLAQGKRVLVTAHTDRALKEVRDKLPAAIKPLAVAVVGTSREDMSDLRVAVERIAATAADHDHADAQRQIAHHHTAVDQLRRRRAELYRRLVAAREHEVHQHEYAGYRGTLAAVAQQLQSQADRFGWLGDHVSGIDEPTAPLTSAEAVEWHGYLCDQALTADEPQARQRLVEHTPLPTPDQFADLISTEHATVANAQQHRHLAVHPAFQAVRRMDPPRRNALRSRLHTFADEIDNLTRRREPWLPGALSDVLGGRGGIWQARAQQIAELVGRVTPLVERLGPVTQVRVAQAEVGPLVALALGVQPLAQAGRFKSHPNGMPKISAFSPKPLKDAQLLFDQVRVDDLPPSNPERLAAFLTWAEATKVLDALDRAWPGPPLQAEDTLHERLQEHVTELDQLHRLLRLGHSLVAEEQQFVAAGLPLVDWSGAATIRTYAALADAAEAADAAAAATGSLQRLEMLVHDTARWSDAAPCVHQLHAAVHGRNHQEYREAHRRLERLHEVRRLISRRDSLGDRLALRAAPVRHAVEPEPAAAAWTERLGDFDRAWRWAATETWVLRQTAADANQLQAEVSDVERSIRDHVEKLAATRAWTHAVSEDRLTGQSRANLEQYAYLVRRLGKGTGKYTAQRKSEIRQAMDRCRPAVPVWIMPIYRIADQLRIQQDMFDVVIVDEASQAGLEAIFLQYMAPKIVVIGDDKQVSPTAVGVDQQQLRDLAGQYLADDPYRASWQDPQRSLFDEAKMRFGGLLTLVEHRRCVPEIIGFSNRIAYEPDGIRLIPVRQYGADRLDPIRTVFLSDGYAQGNTHKVNPVEADAIVDQIEKCLADPRYDGLTFGVISLQGTAQAKIIETRLLDRIDSKELIARDLRCGDSADFQGSERDVMFLSMVAAPEPGRRMGTMTATMYVQRYNVAASRAKDQMWLFHSVSLSDVSNTEDMRFQLLDYCLGVADRTHRGIDGLPPGSVPDDRRVSPFDSLFEQRVYNRLVDRGYTVIPQYEVNPYRIDLVVRGGHAQLAIECDGDAWHGPDAHNRDLARQRDLERCGWRFHRIRESAFYIDQPSVLAELWATLAELEIHPSGWTPDQPPDTVGAPVAHSAAAPMTPAPIRTIDAETVLVEPTVVVQRPDSESITLVEPFWPTSDEDPVQVLAVIDEEPATEAATELIIEAFSDLPPYREFLGSTASALTGAKQDLVEGVVAIVEAEGPVMGHRLHGAYVKASGGQRVGKLVAAALNSAVTTAVRRGLIVQDDPLGEAGVKPRTYRMPGRPEVHMRQVGPRPLEHIPPRELAALLTLAADEHGWEDEELLFRSALGRLGLKRLTTNAKQHLRSVLRLARAE